jgi:hypothetical protein
MIGETRYMRIIEYNVTNVLEIYIYLCVYIYTSVYIYIYTSRERKRQ